MGVEQGGLPEKIAFDVRNVGAVVAVAGALVPELLGFAIVPGVLAAIGGEVVGHELKIHRT